MAAALSRVYAGLCRRYRLTSKECPFWLYLFCGDMEAVFENVCKVFGFQGFQIEEITHILEKGIDIFVNLPTGYGKSVIHRSCSLTRSLTTLII